MNAKCIDLQKELVNMLASRKIGSVQVYSFYTEFSRSPL